MDSCVKHSALRYSIAMTNRRLRHACVGVLTAASIVASPARAGQGAPARASTNNIIVFVGSSIFHRWTNLAAQMAPLPILNRAFDGAQTSDMLRGFDSFVLPSRPKVVVYYCGSNDVDAGDPADAIFERIEGFALRVKTDLPGARMIFVSINRAPEKRDRWDVVDAVNRRVEAYAATTSFLQFVDVNPVLFNRDGSPRVELYVADQLHFRPQAYEEFARILKPVLSKTLVGSGE